MNSACENRVDGLIRRVISFSFLIAALGTPLESRAVIFSSTGDPSYNTTAPVGALEGSGWQFQGRFNTYLGTPIAPHHFITAKHIGGSVGNSFYYEGEVYTTIASVTDSGSDLRIWEIDGTFESYAPIYSGSSEVGLPLVVFGRGVDRGAVVTNAIATDPPGPKPPVIETITNGWKWGAYNYTQRWGTNLVSSTTTIGSYPMIVAEWNADSGANECMLTDKDSGGAVFIKDGGVWKLAGINYAIGPGWTYSFNGDGSDPFNGAILDFHGDNGLYVKSGTSWVAVSENTLSAFYASRISSRYSWITNNIPDFDRDVDGLPDWWETQFGGDATSMDAGADLDGDGFSNYLEWLADTGPANASSFFEMGVYSNATEIVFSSSTNRLYRIDFRTNLADTNEAWTTEVSWFEPIATQTVKTVTAPTGNRFYRVEVKLR